jgi:hypothetical protein
MSELVFGKDVRVRTHTIKPIWSGSSHVYVEPGDKISIYPQAMYRAASVLRRQRKSHLHGMLF